MVLAVDAPQTPDVWLHPRWRGWSRVWRYLLAAGLGFSLWTAQVAALTVPEIAGEAAVTPPSEEIVGAAILLDLVLGVVALALLPLRRRHPLAVAVATTAATAVSAIAIGASTFAIVSMATWRRGRWLVVVGAVWISTTLYSSYLHVPTVWGTENSTSTHLTDIVVGVAMLAVLVGTGHGIATRRELLASLHARAQAAERERALATEVAREAERTRIAREMHDVLAHRISLVALHAGALAYRDDLTREQVVETAGTIAAAAHAALAELRDVLGVLRDPSQPGAVERPQPTLEEVPALLAEAREAGTDVRLDTDGLDPDAARELGASISRTAFRVVQEALTNARKHAPRQPVEVVLAGEPGGDLAIEVRNRALVTAGAGHRPGVGLVGLTERATLAGGELEHGYRSDGTFVVRARLPWPA
ncbi:sensor histidine kinase [Cellulomonas fimi]|uniref:histidine kinase n=1 Tax=Cellulomonas fimi (strain ATCC 484 / DSM 20113 / JCM 1341 / CCUG 24087 / LMG 16345 / NBRC 15513 / NCIMB 8980 / NCTC 7547 / NRS-133) TaxID=590998 RepID=F4H4X7_CELFA|nr:histidine kinase [Cellulomonas fimi]AEE45457.1 integral membrane sensor signal transduction histidine kinase [Cellulomonas fimi ATCC 484]NNH07316.1 two-component sensor histidine kinase [Cellulomonas fimi]VEH29456.1 Oxygen sensor histidine kinase nreB [Cellulomonas fimi]